MRRIGFYLFFFALFSLVNPAPPTKAAIQNVGCRFDDNLLLDDKKMSQRQSGGGSGGFNFWASKLWDTNKIPYRFDKVKKVEKNQIREAMDMVEKNTCVRFNEVHEISSLSRYVNITNSYGPKKDGCGGCDCITGDVEWHSNKPNVDMTYTGRFDCDYIWLVLHELGHVLGLEHTQRRYDRDDHIIFNEECVSQKDRDLLQFKKFEKNQLNTYNMTYNCNSMMHYPAHWLENEKGCFTMLPKTEKCLEEGIGIGIGKLPLEDDWEMIRKAHCNGKVWDEDKDNKDTTEEVNDDDDDDEDNDNNDDEYYDNYESYEDSEEYDNYENYQVKKSRKTIKNFINSLFGR